MANIILPQVNILNEIDDSTKLIVEQNGEINRYPITDLELGGGDVTIDLNGDNVGEATGVNATLLGGYPAEDYAKTIDIDNMLEIDLYGATAAEPNLVDADTLGGFDLDYFASVEEMNGKLSMELLWENASPTSDFAKQTVSLDLSEYDMVEISFNLQTGVLAISHQLQCKVDGGRVTATTPGTQRYHRRSTNVSKTGINFGDCSAYTYSSTVETTTTNGALIPVFVYGIKGVTV